MKTMYRAKIENLIEKYQSQSDLFKSKVDDSKGDVKVLMEGYIFIYDSVIIDLKECLK